MARVALQLHVAMVVGTGAEAFKLAPVVTALRRRPGVQTTLILSGEQELAADIRAELAADADLAICGATSATFCPALDQALTQLLSRGAPDLLLVLGDSDTAWTAAHVANRIGIAIAHLEAGLRSGHLELPWPQERNREEIDSMAALLLTPCARATRAVADLPGTIEETGSSGVDAIWAALDGRLPPSFRSVPRNILVAARRRDPVPRLESLVTALSTAHSELSITLARSDDPAASYASLVAQLATADLLLTDDGTLHEAAAILGVPTLLLCSTTERWDIVDGGHSLIVGPDPVRIRRAVEALLRDRPRYVAMTRACRAFGDGDSGERIAGAITTWAAQSPFFEPIPDPIVPGEPPLALPLAAGLF